MVQQDKIEIEKADAKNSVEEYVYEMREKMYSVYEKFINEEVDYMYITLHHICK